LSKQKPSWRHRHPMLHAVFKWFGRFAFVGIVIALLVGVGGALYVRDTLQDVPEITEESLRSDPSSNMYAANGNRIWSSAKNRRVYVDHEDLPQQYIDMLLATEQDTFYEDPGFSPKGLINAFLSVVKNAFGQGEIRGGSSIEQQLIKLTAFSTSAEDRTVDRKIKEFYLANQLYENYSKDQILEFYVNKLALSENSFGAQTLARTYYDKPLDELSTAKLALIAGAGQAPSAYNVYEHPENAKNRRDTVLYLSKEQGAISGEDYQNAVDEPIDDGLMPQGWQQEKNENVVIQYDGYIQETLNQIEAMGYNLSETPLQIHTALQPDLHNHIRDLFNNHPEYFQDETHQAAATVIENQTGRVLAQVGGRNKTQIGGINRATGTTRSTGSSTKPFIYASGMEKYGWGTSQPFSGANYRYAGTDVWAYNYGMQQVGQTNLQEALRKSYNTPVLRAFDQVGATDVAQTLSDLGLPYYDNLTSSHALGLNASTEHVSSAFSTVANGGTYRQPQYATKIVFPDKSERTIEQTGEQAIQSSTAWQVIHTLQGVDYAQEDGRDNAYVEGLPQALKTGTVAYPDGAGNPSNTAMDLWTTGATPDVSLAIWHGYDAPMDNGWLYEEYMSQRKHDLYRDIIKKAVEPYEGSGWSAPDSVTQNSGDGLSAHYTPDAVITSHFDAHPTHETLDEQTKPYFGSKEEETQVERGDEEYEQVPEDYELGQWKDDVDAFGQDVDEQIQNLQEQKDQLDQEWQEEKEQLTSDNESAQDDLDEAQKAYEEEVQALEEDIQEAQEEADEQVEEATQSE